MLLGTLGVLMLGNMLSGNGVMRAEKDVVRAGGGYNNMNHMDKNFPFHSIFSAISRLPNNSTTSLGLLVFFQDIIYLE